jgi:hypothetical protein
MRVGKIEPRDKRFIVVRLQGHLPCPTPLPEHLTREFSSLYQQAPLWRRKPYTPIYTPQQLHNLITTSTQLLHTYSLLNHTSSSHLSSTHQSFSHQSSTHQSSSHQLFYTPIFFLTYLLHN